MFFLKAQHSRTGTIPERHSRICCSRFSFFLSEESTCPPSPVPHSVLCTVSPAPHSIPCPSFFPLSPIPCPRSPVPGPLSIGFQGRVSTGFSSHALTIWSPCKGRSEVLRKVFADGRFEQASEERALELWDAEIAKVRGKMISEHVVKNSSRNACFS